LVGVSGLLLLIATGPVYRITGISNFGFIVQLLRWAAYLGLVAMAISAVGLVAQFSSGFLATVVALLALAIGAFDFGMPYSLQNQAFSVPAIHDITTDTEDLPIFVAIVPLRANAPNTLDYSSDVAAQQKAAYPEIQSLRLELVPDVAFMQAHEVAKGQGWEIVDTDRSTGRIEATDTTFWYGFKDDVVVRLRPEGSATRVDVRSVSRVGLGDLGKNASRIRAYLEALRNVS
jgi:uncharacterized protein (DUF1499 family)